MRALLRTRIASDYLQIGTTFQCAQAGNHHPALLLLGKVGVEHITDELTPDRRLLADRRQVVGRGKVA